MVNKTDEDMQILFLSTRCWNCTSNLFIIKLLCYSSSFPPSPSPRLFIYTSIQQLHRCPSVRLPFPVESAMEWVVMKLEDNIKFFTFIKCSLHYLQFPSHPHNFSFRHKIHLLKLFKSISGLDVRRRRRSIEVDERSILFGILLPFTIIGFFSSSPAPHSFTFEFQSIPSPTLTS